MSRQMVRYSSGEVRVIDLDLMLASDWLHYAERDYPLLDYALDYDLAPCDLGEYVVIREEVGAGG